MSNQPNYGQPDPQKPYQDQYPQAPYGQHPYQGQYQPVNYQYQVPNGLQTDAAKHRRISNIAFGIAIGMGIIGFGLLDATTVFHSQLLLDLFLVVTAIAWLTACCYSAKSKGYSGWIGLLAIFGLIGLLILVLLPSRIKVNY